MPSSDVLKRVWKYKLGLRVGTDLNGAAYAMCDLGDPRLSGLDVLRFGSNPNSDTPRAQAWDARLRDTIEYIKADAVNHSGTLLLVTSTPDSGERYGQEQTFRKCIKLAGATEVARRAFVEGTPVDELVAWVMAGINAQPDPGAAWL